MMSKISVATFENLKSINHDASNVVQFSSLELIGVFEDRFWCLFLLQRSATLNLQIYKTSWNFSFKETIVNLSSSTPHSGKLLVKCS